MKGKLVVQVLQPLHQFPLYFFLLSFFEIILPQLNIVLLSAKPILVFFASLVKSWRQALLIVKPDTLVMATSYVRTYEVAIITKSKWLNQFWNIIEVAMGSISVKHAVIPISRTSL